MGIVDLLERTLKAPGDETLLEELRRNSRAVLEQLDTPGGARRLEALVDLRDVDPDWLARVFEALAGDPEGGGVAPEGVPHEDEDRRIGALYRDVLSKSLPPPLGRLERWLAHVPELQADEQELLAHEPAVLAADPFPGALIARGVSPLVVYQAFEAVSALVRRAAKRKILTPDQPMTIDVVEGFLSAGPDPIRAETLVAEIAVFADCNLDLARGLAHWLIPAAWCLPRGFGGARVERTHAGVELFPLVIGDMQALKANGPITMEGTDISKGGREGAPKAWDPDLAVRWRADPSATVSDLGDIVASTIELATGGVLVGA